MKTRRKNPHAVALGRLGGKKGGPARAAAMTAEERQERARKGGIARNAKLSAEQRSEVARNAAQARWGRPRLAIVRSFADGL